MIEIDGLVKQYGAKTAVAGISCRVEPGRVTGFLGPNGAGKSTTMRAIVGLDRPTAGTVTVNGRRYRDAPAPLTEVGALLDAKAVHPGRTAVGHLSAVAATHGIGRERVQQVIETAGLASVAKKRVRGFSLGMGQRLGVAAALLGDPRVLILDEPVNGLDPEGVLWIRHLVKSLAAEGRTVFLSSHLMSEMAQTADHLIVLGRGRILADAPMAEVLAGGTRKVVRVRSPQLSALLELLPGATSTPVEPSVAEITGVTAEQVGDLAAANRIALHELTPVGSSLEEAYLELTQDAVEFRSEPAA